MTDSNIRLIELPRFLDPRGNLTFAQSAAQVPFTIQRTFWTYDIPGGEIRGGHAYYQQEEVVIAVSGSFDVVVTKADGTQVRTTLNRSYHGLYLPASAWRHMENFSTNSLILHIASTVFQASDYIYDFEVYQKHLKSSSYVPDHP
jgi:hypothetical protein